jgi:hypothetical protein
MQQISGALSGCLSKPRRKEIRGVNMGVSTRNALAGLFAICALTLGSGSAVAQLNADPTTLPLPDFSLPDPDRAVVLSVQFNSATEMQLLDVAIANVRAPGSLGNPPLLKLELLDQNGVVIREQNEWHPLWTREWDDSGAESAPVLLSGPGTFFVPLVANLAAVRITDIESSQVLLTADVAQPVAVYCADNPAGPMCNPASGVQAAYSALAAPDTLELVAAAAGAANPSGELVISNTGDAGTILTGVCSYAGDSQISIAAGNFSLGQGSEHAVTVSCQTTTEGTYAGTISCEHDGGNVASPVVHNVSCKVGDTVLVTGPAAPLPVPTMGAYGIGLIVLGVFMAVIRRRFDIFPELLKKEP